MPLLIQAPNREERILPHVINAIGGSDPGSRSQSD